MIRPHADLPTPVSWLAKEGNELKDLITAAGFDPATAEQRQVMALASEAGEFVGAYMRWRGQSRRIGSVGDVCLELADVVITAYITAAVLNIDLDAWCAAKLSVIHTREWQEGDR